MTTILPMPDPDEHWSDYLAEKASKDWARQHRLQWLWLRLRQRLKGPPRESALLPGEGHCPGLREIELDPDETARIRRAWLRHVARYRYRIYAEGIRKAQEEEQRQQERWIKGGIGPEDLKRLRRNRASERRLLFAKRVLLWIAGRR
jgi:hypothetical protein